MFLQTGFDSSLIQVNQVLALRLSNPCNDFRINERIFTSELGNRQMPGQPIKKTSNNIVHKMISTPNSAMNPLQMAKTSGYMHAHAALHLARTTLATHQTSPLSTTFTGRQIQPLEWIGTQRSAFTHRKN